MCSMRRESGTTAIQGKRALPHLLVFLAMCVCVGGIAPMPAAAEAVVGFLAPESRFKENAGTVNITVAVSEQVPHDLTVNYSLGGTAAQAADYSVGGTAGQILLPANSLAGTISVTLQADVVQESDETVVFTITSVSAGASLGASLQHVLTIVDDDLPAVNFAVSAYSGPESVGRLNIRVDLSKSPTAAVDATYTMSGTMAGDGSDFLPLSGKIHFNAAQQTIWIPLDIIDDTEPEFPETLVLDLSGATNATIGSVKRITLTITDNDPPMATFTTGTLPLRVEEKPQDVNLYVDLSRANTVPVTVSFELDGTATKDKDYEISVNSLSFAPGTMRMPVPIKIKDDTEFEADEDIVVRLTGATNATVGGKTEDGIIIIDNEVPSVEFLEMESSVAENAGSKFVTFKLSNAFKDPVEAKYTVEGTAKPGVDYQPLAGKVIFAANQVEQTVTVNLLDNKSHEDNRTIILRLTDAGANANLGVKTDHTLTILDDDQYPPVQISPKDGVNASVPDVCIDKNTGNAHIIWKANNALWYARVSSNMEIKVPAKLIYGGPSNPVLVPRAAVDAHGVVHVVHATTSRGQLNYVRIASNGNFDISQSFQIYASASFPNQTYDWPAIAVLPGEELPVVVAQGRIQDNAVPVPGGKDFIATVKLGRDGRPVISSRWAAFDRNFGWGVGYSFDGAGRPDIAIDSSGFRHVVWKHQESSWGGNSVAYRCNNPAAAGFPSPNSAPLELNLTRNVLNTYGGPQICTGKDGHVEAVWCTTDLKVMYQEMTSLGQWTDDPVIVSDLKAKTKWPEVAGGDGKVFFGWMDDRGAPTQIFSRNSSDLFFSRNISESPAGGAGFVRMAARSNQSVDYVWSDSRGAAAQSIFYRTWNSGAIIQPNQDYDRGADVLALAAKVFDPSQGEITGRDAATFQWQLYDLAKTQKAGGDLKFDSVKSMWTASSKIEGGLMPGSYRVEYKIKYMSALSRAMEGEASGNLIVGSYYTLKGKVTDKETKKPVEGVEVAARTSLKTRPSVVIKKAFTNDKGEYEIKDLVASKAQGASFFKNPYRLCTREVELEAGKDQVVMDVLMGPELDRPEVSADASKFEYDGIFLSLPLLSFSNTFNAVVDWGKDGAPGLVEFYANDKLLASVPGEMTGASLPIDIYKTFPGIQSEGANRLGIQATDNRGKKSDMVEFKLRVIELPSCLLPVFAVMRIGHSLNMDPVLEGEYTIFKSGKPKVIPLIGKFGPDINLKVKGKYEFKSGKWEVSAGGNPGGDNWEDKFEDWKRAEKKKEEPKLNATGEEEEEEDKEAIDFKVGEFTAEGNLNATVEGTATITKGFEFKTAKAGLVIEGKGKVAEFLLTDAVVPMGRLARLFNWLAKWGFDLNSLQRIAILFEMEAKGEANFELSPAIKFTTMDIGFKPGLKAVYNPKVNDSLQCTVTGGTEGEITVNVLPECKGITAGGFKLYASVEAKVGVMKFGPATWDIVSKTYPESSSALPLLADGFDISGGTPLVWTPVSRDYLANGPSRFVAEETGGGLPLAAFRSMSPATGGIRPAMSPLDSPAPRQADLTIVVNVFPEPEPAIAATGSDLMLIYVDDNSSVVNPLQFTDIRWTRFNGTAWSAPASIQANTQAEFAPTVAFDGAGDAIALWQRVKKTDFNSANPTDLAKELEIVWSRWNRASNTWTAPAALTNNDHLDHSPRLCGPTSDGSLLAVWTENPANLFIGAGADGTTSNSLVLWSKWSSTAKTWSASATLVSNLTGRLSQTLAGRGDTAVYAYTRDMGAASGSISDTEVFYKVWNGTTWSASPVRLTNDSTADSAVRAAVDAAGHSYLIWQADSDLVMSRDLATTASLVRSGSREVGFADYAMTLGPNGNLALVWQDQNSAGPNPSCIVYDPSSDHWSEDISLLSDAPLEYSFAPAWDNSGNLVLAYGRQEMTTSTVTLDLEGGGTATIHDWPARGQADLAVLKRSLVRDLAALDGDLLCDAGAGLPASQVRLAFRVRNLGDLPVTGVEVAFYDGNPQADGTRISLQTVPGYIGGGQNTVMTAEWTVPEPAAPHTVYAVIDPDSKIAEFNEYNNTQWAAFGGTDLTPAQSLDSTVQADGSARVVVRVVNNGGPAAPDSTLGIRVKDSGGAALATAGVPTVAPGAVVDVPLNLPAGSIPAGDIRTFTINTDDTNVVPDVNAANDTLDVALSSLQMSAAAPAQVVGILADPALVPVPEGGTQILKVRLDSMPAANVTLNVARLSGDTDLTVQSGASLTFTRSNWNTPQTVTLAAAEDADSAAGTAVFRISAPGIANKDINARELDNEAQNNVSGSIATNTTWNDTTKDYVLTGIVTIPAGVTLTIGPNVNVRGTNSDTYMVVQGTVNASQSQFLLYTACNYWATRSGIYVQDSGFLNADRCVFRSIELVPGHNGDVGWWDAIIETRNTSRLTIRGCDFESLNVNSDARTRYGIILGPDVTTTIGDYSARVTTFKGLDVGINNEQDVVAKTIAVCAFTDCPKNMRLYGRYTNPTYNMNGSFTVNNKGVYWPVTTTIKSGGSLTLAPGSELLTDNRDSAVNVESGAQLTINQALASMYSQFNIYGTLTATSSTLIQFTDRAYWDPRHGVVAWPGGVTNLTATSIYSRDIRDTTDWNRGWFSCMLYLKGPDTGLSLPGGSLQMDNCFLSNLSKLNGRGTYYGVAGNTNLDTRVTSSGFLNNYVALHMNPLPTTHTITENYFKGSVLNSVENYKVMENTPNAPILYALRNWWGSATGPRHVSNPGGLGDPVSDGVDFRDNLIETQFPMFTLSDPVAGQEINNLPAAGGQQNNIEMIGFRISPGSSNIQRIRFDLVDPAGSFSWDQIANFRLFEDTNGDGLISATETTAVGGVPQVSTFTETPGGRAIVFKQAFTSAASPTTGYILVADLRDLAVGQGFTVVSDDMDLLAKPGIGIETLVSRVRHMVNTVTVADPATGQEGNNLTALATQNKVELFGFRLQGPAKSVEKLTLNLSNVRGISAPDLSSVKLYVDTNLNGNVDPSETTVGGTPAVTIGAGTGTIVFSALFDTGKSYILTSNLDNAVGGDAFTVSLPAANVDLVGTLDTVTGSVSDSTQKVGYPIQLTKTPAWAPPTDFGAAVNQIDVPIQGFRLLPTGKTIQSVQLKVRNGQGIGSGDIANVKLYCDKNANNMVDAGDLLLASDAVVQVQNGWGTITFNTPFTTQGNLIVTADFANLEDGDEVVIALESSGITAGLTDVVTGSTPEVRLVVGTGLANGVNRNMKWTLSYRSPGGTAVSGRFNHAGNRIILGYNTGSAWVYDSQSNTPLVMLKDHYDAVRYAGFSSDDSAAVTVSRDGAVYIWDLASSGTLRTSMFSDLLVDYAVPSPDFSKLMVITEGKGMLLDIDTQQRLWEFIPGAATVNAIAYAPDGNSIVLGCSDKRAYLLNSRTGVEIKRFLGHSQPVTAVGFTGDGSNLMTASTDATANLWNVATKTVIRTVSLTGQNAQGAAVSLDGQRICMVTGAGDNAQLRMYNEFAAEMYAININTLSGGAWGGTLENVVFDDAAQTVLVNSSGKGWACSSSFRVTDGAYQRSWGPKGSVSIYQGNRPRISADGERVFYSGNGGMDLLFRTKAVPIHRSNKYVDLPYGISPDGTKVAFIDWAWDGVLHVETVNEEGFSPTLDYRKTANQFNYVGVYAVSPDGNTAAVGDRLFSTQTGLQIANYASPDANNWSAFSPDGTRWGFSLGASTSLVTCLTSDPNATLFRMVDTTPYPPGKLIYHPDNIRVGCQFPFEWSRGYGGFQMYDMDTGDPVGLFRFEGDVYDTALSADGSMLLVGGNNTVRLFDVKTGSVLRYFYPQHSSLQDVRVRTVEFAKDDTLIMIAWSYNYIETYERSRAAEIAVTPATRTLAPGQSQEFTVEIVYDDSTRRDITPTAGETDPVVALEILPAGRATVDHNVVTVAPGAFGQLSVRARYRENGRNLVGEALVTVGTAELVKLVADPAKLESNAGVFLPIRYYAEYADKYQLEVTKRVTITPAAPDDIEVSSQSIRVKFTAMPGLTYVTGSYRDSMGTEATARTDVTISGLKTAWERYRVTGGGYGLSGAFRGDGKQLAVGSSSGAINLYDVGATPSQYVLKDVVMAHSGPIRYLAYLNSGSIVTVSEDGTIKTWNTDAPTTTPLMTYQANAPLTAACLRLGAWPETRNLLAFGDAQGNVGLFDTGAKSLVWQVPVHAGAANCVALDVDTVLSGGGDKKVKALSLANGNVIRTLSTHTQPIVGVGYFGADSFYSLAQDKTLTRWRKSTYDVIERYEYPSQPTVATVIGANLYVGTQDPVGTWVYDVNGLLLRWMEHLPAEGIITHYMLDPSGKYIVTGRITGKKTKKLTFMGMDMGEEQTISPFSSFQFWEVGRGIFRGSLAHSHPMNDAQVANDGNRVYSQDPKRTMSWDFGAGTAVQANRLMETGFLIAPSFTHMDFTDDYSILATRVGVSIFMYDTVDNLLWKTLHTPGPGPFAISPDRTRMATSDFKTRLWDLANLSQIREESRVCAGVDFYGETYFLGALHDDRFIGIWNSAGLMSNGMDTLHMPIKLFVNETSKRCIAVTEEVSGDGSIEPKVYTYYLETYNISDLAQEPVRISSLYLLSIQKQPELFGGGGDEDVAFSMGVSSDATLALIGPTGKRPVKLISLKDGTTIREFLPPIGDTDANIGASAVKFMANDNGLMIGWREGYTELYRRMRPTDMIVQLTTLAGPGVMSASGAVRTEEIRPSADSEYKVRRGQTVQINTTAIFGNGATMNVTNSVSYTEYQTSRLAFSGSKFTVRPTSPLGIIRLKVHYEEPGVVMDREVLLRVVPPPAGVENWQLFE